MNNLLAFLNGIRTRVKDNPSHYDNRRMRSSYPLFTILIYKSQSVSNFSFFFLFLFLFLYFLSCLYFMFFFK
ncbi:unnamed protein product, partial [Vitis vinifera]